MPRRGMGGVGREDTEVVALGNSRSGREEVLPGPLLTTLEGDGRRSFRE